MQIICNGKIINMPKGSTAKDIGDFDVFVRNGYGITKQTELFEGDNIVAVKSGQVPNKEDFNQMIFARNGKDASDKLNKSCVCICGLGGLGSNIAEMLTRLGIGKLILVDYDIVDPTNLNRQNYFVSDIGSLKTDATTNILLKINPYVQIVKKNVFVNSKNILEIIECADIVVEAFDSAKSKAEIVNTILAGSDKIVVASSGMAGIGSSNLIKTNKPMSRLYICGDMQSEAKEGLSLMSPRVNICAAHQANMVERILLGEVEC